MRVNRILIVLLLVMIVSSTVFGGCTIKTPGEEGTTVRITKSFKENELFFLEEELCTVSEAKLFLMNQKNLYTGRYGQEIWSATYEGEPLYTYLEDNLRDFLVRLKCMVLMAASNEITLSGDDMTLISLATTDYYNALSQAEIDYADVTEQDIKEAFSDYFLANKLYRVLTQDATKEISDDEARIITIQMIYLPYDQEDSVNDNEGSETSSGTGGGSEGNTEDTARETETPSEAITSQELINELHKRVTQDEEDFYTLAEGYSRGEWTENQIQRGEMEPAVETAAFALSSGAISKVVNGETGYYIIKCINNHEIELTNVHRQELIEEWKKEVFRAEYDAFVSKLYLRFNDVAWDLIDFGAVVPEYTDSFYSCYERFLSGNE